MEYFFKINVLSFWKIIVHFINNNLITSNSNIISIGSTAIFQNSEYFNPSYMLSKSALMKSSEIFQDMFLNLEIKFCHLILGSLGENLIQYSDVLKCIHFLLSIYKGCFPSQIIMKPESELT